MTEKSETFKICVATAAIKTKTETKDEKMYMQKNETLRNWK